MILVAQGIPIKIQYMFRQRCRTIFGHKYLTMLIFCDNSMCYNHTKIVRYDCMVSTGHRPKEGETRQTLASIKYF